MIYLIGFFGFIGGFILGQFLLLRLLRNRPKEELLNSKSVKWIYGSMNWFIAIMGALATMNLYSIYTH